MSYNSLNMFIKINNIIMLQTVYYCCCQVISHGLTLCDPMDWSMPGFPVLHHLLELPQMHVH